MRPPGCLRLVPGWGVPGRAAPLSLPAPAVWHDVSNRVWGIAMETGAGPGGTPFSLAAPLARVIFSFCLPQSGLSWLGNGAGLDWDFQRGDWPGLIGLANR